MHKHLGHALAQSSLATVLRALKPAPKYRPLAMVLRSFVHIDDTQSLFVTFDLYIIIIDVIFSFITVWHLLQ